MSALLAMAAVMLVPTADAEPYIDITGEKSVIKTGDSREYSIVYDDETLVSVEDKEISIKFTAKLVNSAGETQTNAVSPSSGSLKNGETKALTVTAPKSAGTFKLDVEFVCTVGEEEREPVAKQYEIVVVNPVKLEVSLKGSDDSNIDPSGVGVYFYVDGKKMEDSYTTFTLNKNGTATVSYELVDDLSDGAHTFWVESAEGNDVVVKGLGEEHTFYVGEKSYTMWIALVAVVLVLVIILFIWVYRKPVKNFGKPKSRR